MKKELVLEVIRERWSPYSFLQAEIEDYKLKAMFEAAGYASSCNNEQPWLFVYATRQNLPVFNKFLSFLEDRDRSWTGNAYTLCICLARLTFKDSGKQNKFAYYDTGMAVSNLLAQAYTFDINVHQIYNFDVTGIKEYLSPPVDAEPMTMMAIGYLGDGTALQPGLLQEDDTKRSVRSVNEFTFKNSFSEAAF